MKSPPSLIKFFNLIDLQIINLQTHLLNHLLSNRINIASTLQSRSLRNVVISSFSFFFLQFDRNTSNGSLLDSFHGVGDETSDLVLQPFGGDGGDVSDDSSVGVVVQGQSSVVFLDDSSGSFFDGFGSDSAHFFDVGWIKVLKRRRREMVFSYQLFGQIRDQRTNLKSIHQPLL